MPLPCRFTTLDIISILEELQEHVGMRVTQVTTEWRQAANIGTLVLADLDKQLLILMGIYAAIQMCYDRIILYYKGW